MNTALLHGLPVLAIIAVIALIYFRRGNRPPTYTLAQPWTHAPILWAATDEVIPGGHSGHGRGGHGDHSESVVNVGGGASGRW